MKHTRIGITDLDGILRGKYISNKKLAQIKGKGFGFCNVIFGWDMNDQCYDNAKVSGWHTGYPDALAMIDEKTLRHIPWEKDTPFLLADFAQADENIAAVCPTQFIETHSATMSSDGF